MSEVRKRIVIRIGFEFIRIEVAKYLLSVCLFFYYGKFLGLVLRI